MIDNNPLDRAILTKILTQAGIEVSESETGEAGLTAITEKRPDLVLLDLVLPGLDGNSILRKLRETYSSLELPIIMVTVKADTQDIVESFRLGANDYVMKPALLEVVVLRVQNHLNLARLSKEAAQTKEIEAIHAMVTTYNHEINNPLTVALVVTEKLIKNSTDPKDLLKIENSLQRIHEIVKRIQKVSVSDVVEYDQYSQKSKMVKIK